MGARSQLGSISVKKPTPEAVAGVVHLAVFCTSIGSGSAEYIVVTFLVGSDDSPLFGEVYSREELKVALERIAAMPPKYLLIFELIWSPQEESDSLSDDGLVTSYSNLVQI